MKKSLALLIASTALTAAIGTFAWSAMPGTVGSEDRAVASLLDDAAEAIPFILASDDDDEEDDDDDSDNRKQSTGGDDDDDEECDDDNCGRGSARNPAPAGTVAPPENGLFGDGTPPQVQVN